jgi:hypothetical protein
MSTIYNEQQVVGIRLVADGTTMFNQQPVIGVRNVGATLFTANLRTLGVAVLGADQAIYNDQPVIGAVSITDARTIYNGLLVEPASAVSGVLP